MSKTVYVITNPELGWDCVVAVVDSLSPQEINVIERKGYVVSEQICQSFEQFLGWFD